MTRPSRAPAVRRRALAAAAATAVTALTVVAGPGTASASYRPAPVELRTGIVGSSPDGPTLFGVTPGTAPWVADGGRVRLDARGNLDVRVRRLVIPTAPANGTNPVPMLSASLVCNGAVVATTATVPFNARGNAHIDTRVAVPRPCLAPAVLIHPGANTGVYIAASG